MTRRTPTIPPISTPLVNEDGRLNQAWYQFLSGERGYSTNVNRAAAQAAAQAVAAQAAATAAAITAQNASNGVVNAFVVTADTSSVFAYSGLVGVLTTDAVTVTASGGTAPYTYAWSKVSGDTVTIDSPAAASTTFSGDPGLNGTLSGQYQCTVTDAAAQTGSVTIGVTIINSLISG